MATYHVIAMYSKVVEAKDAGDAENKAMELLASELKIQDLKVFKVSISQW